MEEPDEQKFWKNFNEKHSKMASEIFESCYWLNWNWWENK